MTTTSSLKNSNYKNHNKTLSPEERQAHLVKSSAEYLKGKLRLEDYKRELQKYDVDDNLAILENSGFSKRFIGKVNKLIQELRG